MPSSKHRAGQANTTAVYVLAGAMLCVAVALVIWRLWPPTPPSPAPEWVSKLEQQSKEFTDNFNGIRTQLVQLANTKGASSPDLTNLMTTLANSDKKVTDTQKAIIDQLAKLKESKEKGDTAAYDTALKELEKLRNDFQGLVDHIKTKAKDSTPGEEPELKPTEPKKDDAIKGVKEAVGTIALAALAAAFPELAPIFAALGLDLGIGDPETRNIMLDAITAVGQGKPPSQDQIDKLAAAAGKTSGNTKALDMLVGVMAAGDKLKDPNSDMSKAFVKLMDGLGVPEPSWAKSFQDEMMKNDATVDTILKQLPKNNNLPYFQNRLEKFWSINEIRKKKPNLIEEFMTQVRSL
jgi:hypothetical protein